MTGHELLAELDMRGGRYRVDGADFKIKGPIPADLAEEIRAHKPGIIDELSVPGIEDGGDHLVRWMVANKVMYMIEGDSLRWECPPALAETMADYTARHGRAAIAAMFRARVQAATADRERCEKAGEAMASPPSPRSPAPERSPARRSLIDGTTLQPWDCIHLIENCRWADCGFHHPEAQHPERKGKS